MPGKNPPIIYWDSCIFISWLNGETIPQRTQEEIDGVEEQVEQFDNEKITLATSVISLTEVFSMDILPEYKDTLNEIINRDNFLLVDVMRPVATIANEIREYYQKQKAIDDFPTMETPDALHLATAIYIDANIGACSVLHTYDGSRKGKSSKKRRTMISLGGKVAGKYLLKIAPPSPSSGPSLFTAVSGYSSYPEDADDDEEVA